MQAAPGPRVAKPNGRQQVQRRRFRAAIGRRHPDQDVVRRRFGVLHEDVEVAMVIKNARVQQFKLRVLSAPPMILVDQQGVRELGLRILVKGLQVRRGGRRIQVEIALLHVFAMVAFGVGQAEQTLLQDRVPAIPKGQGKAETTFAVGDPQQTVFPPAVGAAAGVRSAENTPSMTRRANSLRARCPTDARPDRGPTVSSSFRAGRLPRAAPSRRRCVVFQPFGCHSDRVPVVLGRRPAGQL